MSGGDDGRVTRRGLLRAGLFAGLGIAGLSFLSPAGGLIPRIVEDPANTPPKPGDRLVFAQGPHQGDVVTPDRVPAGGPQVLAWPMDPATRTIRSANTKNLVILVRATARAWFGAAELPHTAANVAAYAATCTHLCCTVSDWQRQELDWDTHGHLECPCHKSKFDPWDGARVLSGPAPRPLPTLPLTTAGGDLVVAAGFMTPVGCSQV